jgi:hypothetical protein
LFVWIGNFFLPLLDSRMSYLPFLRTFREFGSNLRSGADFPFVVDLQFDPCFETLGFRILMRFRAGFFDPLLLFLDLSLVIAVMLELRENGSVMMILGKESLRTFNIC